MCRVRFYSILYSSARSNGIDTELRATFRFRIVLARTNVSPHTVKMAKWCFTYTENVCQNRTQSHRHTFAIWRAISFAQSSEMHSCVFPWCVLLESNETAMTTFTTTTTSTTRKSCDIPTSSSVHTRVFAMQFIFIWWLSLGMCQANARHYANQTISTLDTFYINNVGCAQLFIRYFLLVFCVFAARKRVCVA